MTSEQKNTGSLVQLRQYIAERKPVTKKQYGQLLVHDLARQQWHGCFQRNVLAVLEQAYDEALTYIQTLSFDYCESSANQELSNLTQQALTLFDSFVDEFLLFVVDKHRTSCALSNFPDEHKPDKAYVNEVMQKIAGLRQNFALNANAYFLQCR